MAQGLSLLLTSAGSNWPGIPEVPLPGPAGGGGGHGCTWQPWVGTKVPSPQHSVLEDPSAASQCGGLKCHLQRWPWRHCGDRREGGLRRPRPLRSLGERRGLNAGAGTFPRPPRCRQHLLVAAGLWAPPTATPRHPWPALGQQDACGCGHLPGDTLLALGVGQGQLAWQQPQATTSPQVPSSWWPYLSPKPPGPLAEVPARPRGMEAAAGDLHCHQQSPGAGGSVLHPGDRAGRPSSSGLRLRARSSPTPTGAAQESPQRALLRPGQAC